MGYKDLVKNNKIEKKWCILGDNLVNKMLGIAKILEENVKIPERSSNKRFVRVQYGDPEAQLSWDKNGYIRNSEAILARFDTLEEAIEHYIKHRPERYNGYPDERTDEEVRIEVIEHFPSYFGYPPEHTRKPFLDQLKECKENNLTTGYKCLWCGFDNSVCIKYGGICAETNIACDNTRRIKREGE